MALARTDTYIPLSHASQKYGIPEKALLKRVHSGSIASAQLPNGDYLVAENNLDPSLNIKREDFEHLRGKKIAVGKASNKYGVPQGTLSRWAKSGYIKVLERGYRSLLDEADVAYCATVYQKKYDFYEGQMTGVTIFDKEGNPYKIKNQEIALYKRSRRRKNG